MTDEIGKEDFTIEYDDYNGKIENVRITKGKALYRIPWWRRLLMWLIGRSHWHRHRIVFLEHKDGQIGMPDFKE